MHVMKKMIWPKEKDCLNGITVLLNLMVRNWDKTFVTIRGHLCCMFSELIAKCIELNSQTRYETNFMKNESANIFISA